MQEIELFYLDWRSVPETDIVALLLDDGSPEYVERIRAVWQDGAYSMVATVELDPQYQTAEPSNVLEDVWAGFNAGSGSEWPAFTSRSDLRSLSVGDIVRLIGLGFWLCRTAGWQHIDLELEEAG